MRLQLRHDQFFVPAIARINPVLAVFQISAAIAARPMAHVV
jgi:hypothetical protein